MTRRLARRSNPDFVTPLESFLEVDESSHYALSRHLGQILGINIYRRVIMNKEPPARIRRLFKQRTNNPASAWKEVFGLFQLMP